MVLRMKTIFPWKKFKFEKTNKRTKNSMQYLKNETFHYFKSVEIYDKYIKNKKN